jgi:hypothetical protein
MAYRYRIPRSMAYRYHTLHVNVTFCWARSFLQKSVLWILIRPYLDFCRIYLFSSKSQFQSSSRSEVVPPSCSTEATRTSCPLTITVPIDHGPILTPISAIPAAVSNKQDSPEEVAWSQPQDSGELPLLSDQYLPPSFDAE